MMTCRMQVKKSIDDIMWETVQSKLSNVGRVLDGKQDSLKVAATGSSTTHDGGGADGSGSGGAGGGKGGPLDAYLKPVQAGVGVGVGGPSGLPPPPPPPRNVKLAPVSGPMAAAASSAAVKRARDWEDED